MHMTVTHPRERLLSRRLGETFELHVAGVRYTATVGRFPDGRIGEMFLNNHKSNSAADTMHAIPRLCAASRFSTPRTLKPYGKRSAVMATAGPARHGLGLHR
jgi:hypothetical protein